jgi:hypothetical protein
MDRIRQWSSPLKAGAFASMQFSHDGVRLAVGGIASAMVTSAQMMVRERYGLWKRRQSVR